MKNLEILYEDNSIIIINKPAGLAVQGGEKVKISLDKILSEIRTPPPLLVHRLDKDTSGVLLVAKDRKAAGIFSHLLNSSLSAKQYIAVCSGCPAKNEGSITQELLVHGSMKKSETRYKVIKSGKLSNDDFSILELELGTGRMHQIRRHLAMIGNPVLGDDKYGNFSLNKKLHKTNGLKHLLLHASCLKVNNLEISAPVPEYFNPFT